jgi:phosphate transport system substrate-binding protein
MSDKPPFFVPDSAGLDAYPIVTFTWVVLCSHHDDAEKAKALRDLFRWNLLDVETRAFRIGSGYLRTSAPRLC